MKAVAPAVLRFPCASSAAARRAQRKDLIGALRLSTSPMIVDLSGCSSLNHEDIELLLECVAQVAGRDTQVLFVAGSRANRVLLEVTRISSLAPVFNSVEEALDVPPATTGNEADDGRSSKSQELWSA